MAYVMVSGDEDDPLPVTGEKQICKSGQEVVGFVVLTPQSRIAAGVIRDDAVNNVSAHDCYVGRS
jgi:hypothetical protein